MWRVIAALVAALVVWMGLAQPGEAVAAPTPQVVAHSYDAHHHPTPLTRNTSARGPPTAYDHDTAPGPVDLTSRGTSARPTTGNTLPIITYDHLALLVQDAGVVTTTLEATPDSSGLLSSLQRSDVAARTGDGLLSPGPYASRSIPGDATRKFTRQQRDELNEIMGETGCHRCGALSPGTKSGDAIPDHQPPLSQSDGPFQLYPHCLACSREQGLFFANLSRRGGAQ